jgi:tetratricopeptide (TPR) repeat protein
MAKKKNQNEEEEILVDVEEVYSKTEEFINANQVQILGGVAVVAFIILGYFSYVRFYLGPLEEEASSQMFVAEQYFEKDSFNIALNGDATYLGFLDIADEYGATKSGNLARYYAGISHLRLGQYEDAIYQLGKFKGKDVVLSAIAHGATGDAHMEAGDADKALAAYEKAVKTNENEFTTPIYLMKAGVAAEKLGKFDKAISYYGRLKSDFPNTNEGRNADKYLSRAQTSMK